MKTLRLGRCPHSCSRRRTFGFTIVELLIVIIVIAILATITVVAYNGIQKRTYATTLQADFANNAKKAEAYRITSTTSSYPNDLTSIIGADVELSKTAYNAVVWCYKGWPASTDWGIVADGKDGKSYYMTSISRVFTEFTANKVQGTSGGVTCPAVDAGLTGWTWLLQTPTGTWSI